MSDRQSISPNRPSKQRTGPIALEKRWYAVAVHARQERAAATALEDRGFEVFLPTRCERRLWSDRVQRVNMALLPGYLFLRTTLTAASRVQMLRVRQVYDVVGRTPGDAAIARPVATREVESLQALVASERELTAVDRLTQGATVVIADGPLRGARGVLLSDPDGRQLLDVQISLLGRGVRTWISADDLVEPATAA